MSWLALGSFIVTVMVLLAILWSSQEDFSADAKGVIKIATLFQMVCGLLIAEVAFWTLSAL